MRPSQCPTPVELQAFAVGNLTGEQVDEIADHVAHCPQCDGRLQELDAVPDGLVNRLCSFRQFPGALDTAIVPERLLRVAQDALSSNGSGRESDVALDSGRRLARLLEEGECRLGRFELEAELGIGSFGHVFRARDTELDRIVALKIQRTGRFASEEDVARFHREARNVARLKHRGIVSLYDTGTTEDGICFLITEFIKGRTLENLLQNGPIDARTAAALVADVADALQYAHEHGVVHRDVKPSNILIDEQGRPHITDFGLAKRDTGETMTSDGRVMGTPAYMSPEQARGESHHVDARSDVYSLGVILYELLTGERPFQGNQRLLLLQVLEDEPRPPRRLTEDLPRDLETVCLKAMAKTVSGRYQQAADFADDLRRFLAGEPIQARRLSYAQRFWRWCRRYPLAVCLFLAVLFGSSAGLLYVTQLSEDFVRQSALESARAEAAMLDENWRFYAERVDSLNRKTTKIRFSQHYTEDDRSMPLPATYAIDIADRISRSDPNVQARVFSRYPWPGREGGGPRDDFERRSLQRLEANNRRTDRQSNEYYEILETRGERWLWYARPKLMEKSCLSCHNGKEGEESKSPKRNWKVGDVGGVIKIGRRLDGEPIAGRSGLLAVFALMVVSAVSLLAFSAVIIVRRLRSRTLASA